MEGKTMVLRTRLLPTVFAAVAGMLASVKQSMPWESQPISLDQLHSGSIGWKNWISNRSIKDTVPGDISDRLYSHYGKIERDRSMRRRIYSKLVASYRHKPISIITGPQLTASAVRERFKMLSVEISSHLQR